MAQDYSVLKAFITNYLDNERYLDDKTVPLSTDEIKKLAKDKEGTWEDIQLTDRLLNDPEALEILVDLYETESTGNGKIIELPKNKNKPYFSGLLNPLHQEPLKRAAATSKDLDQGTGDAVQVKDGKLSGFIQISEYKNEQFILSGHFELAMPGRYLKLIIPRHKSIIQFRLVDNKLFFREILSDWIDITHIKYELY
jgi:hypothetical protein